VDDDGVDDDTERFTALYDRYRMRVWAYAASRVGSRVADEIVSETFMVAWRRLSDMPPAVLPWLLGVARNVIRDSVRADIRRESLATELRVWSAGSEGDVADGVVDRLAMLRALAQLPESDREVLTLVAWQGLSTKEAARVIGCTVAAFRVRLHRARRRLTAAVDRPHGDRSRHLVETIGMELS
jgi:RNA polymerase sigma-70 factor (ECF subfamily)